MTKGYSQCGLTEILTEAGVPKGSFYYYFQSKEDFGLQLIEKWRENYAEAENNLKDDTLSPLTRVRRFFEARRRLFERLRRQFGSVVGSLHVELANHCETFRCRVQQIVAAWVDQVAACLSLAQHAGEFTVDLDARTLAKFCLMSWDGAVQRARTLQNTEPMDDFFQVMFNNFLTK
jgi:TetR/AcrR family transcriptional repressor of nem operon